MLSFLGSNLWSYVVFNCQVSLKTLKAHIIKVRKDMTWSKLKEERVAVDEAVGWHHQVSGHDLEQTQGGREEQGSLACCSTWGCKGSGNLSVAQNNWTETVWDNSSGSLIFDGNTPGVVEYFLNMSRQMAHDVYFYCNRWY